MLCNLVTVPGLINLSEIFFCVTTTAVSLPLSPTDVKPAWLIALNAYSTWYRRPSGEKMVMCLSNPALVPRDITILYDNSL